MSGTRQDSSKLPSFSGAKENKETQQPLVSRYPFTLWKETPLEQSSPDSKRHDNEGTQLLA